jgi:low temperature requirement protein LtrA
VGGRHTVGRMETRVSSFELFFDLVFVFAFTQVTASVAHDPTWAALGHGVLAFAMLWWAWGAYAWLTNTVPTDQVAPRLVILAAMASMLVVALAVPGAFDDSGPAFGIAYMVVMVLHAALFALASATGDPEVTRRAILRLAATNLPAAAVLIVAGFAEGDLQTGLWIATVGVTYAGPYITGVGGFTVSPSHFVERHGLIALIALGESVVAIGAGQVEDVDWHVATTAFIAIAVIAGLWWTYFDGEADLTEQALHDAQGHDRSRLARDVYSYLHIPIVLGVVLVALGIKSTLAHSSEPLDDVVAAALGGGVALYFAALTAIAWRRGSRPDAAYPIAVVLALAAIALAQQIDAVWSLAALAALALGAAAVSRAHRSSAGPAVADSTTA